MNELFDKEMNAQKESLKKTSGVHTSFRKPTKKCAMKMKESRKKRQVPKIFFDGRKEFVRRMRKTGAMDIKQLQVTNSSYIESTICLVNE